jgi:hypothetical protein
MNSRYPIEPLDQRTHRPMTPQQLVKLMLASDNAVSTASLMAEASVHLPRRGTRWIASFRNEFGRQQTKTTSRTEYLEALAIARQWEAEARKRRTPQSNPPKGASFRVAPGSSERDLGCLTQREVAAIMNLTERGVRQIEKRAIEKLRRHPAFGHLWRQYLAGELDESVFAPSMGSSLSADEVAVLITLTSGPFERRALHKAVLIINANSQPV